MFITVLCMMWNVETILPARYLCSTYSRAILCYQCRYLKSQWKVMHKNVSSCYLSGENLRVVFISFLHFSYFFFDQQNKSVKIQRSHGAGKGGRFHPQKHRSQLVAPLTGPPDPDWPDIHRPWQHHGDHPAWELFSPLIQRRHSLLGRHVGK